MFVEYQRVAKILRHGMIIMAALACYMLCACKEDNPVTPPSPPIEKPTGDVEFIISQEGNDSTGVGTGSSPAVVQTGDTLNMAISQKSSYADPDGSVFVCEPEATIKLSSLGDTLYVKDFKTLTNVKESSSVASETSLGEKLTKKTLQTFNVGGKEVVFDLAYDIINHINSQQQSIEMPYIKLNSANYGTSKLQETRSSRAPVVMTGMRITPHGPQTRGTIVDSTAYDISVAFNLEIESVNTKEPQNQTLSFAVEFLAVVESTTDYPDPTMQFSYQLQVLGGTNSTASPFVQNPGETMHLQWVESSQYSYFSVQDRTSQVIQYEPKAEVKLFASADTLWVTNKEELKQLVAGNAVIAESGSSPQVTTGQKTFNIAGKDITVNWSYDTYAAINAEGSDVAVPYLELSEPQVVSVRATELPNVTIPGKQAKVYEVEVRLSQELKSVNTPEEHTETIEYVVKCIGAFEVKLVKVVYRKDWEWVEPHDNMMLAYYPMVHRDRIYSTGETFTDTFRDAGHVAYITTATQPEISIVGGEEVMEDGTKFFYNPSIRTNIADSIINISGSVSVPDLSLVKKSINLITGEEVFVNYLTSPAGTWDEYVTIKQYTDLDVSLEGVEVIGADGVSTKPSGWYFFAPTYAHYRSYEYNERYDIIILMITVKAYDQFLVIDGQMINFLEFRKPAKFNFKEENITMPNGAPGIVVTYDAHLQFLERNFYGAIIDTIYQQTPDPQPTLPPAMTPTWQRPQVKKYNVQVKDRKEQPQLSPLNP